MSTPLSTLVPPLQSGELTFPFEWKLTRNGVYGLFRSGSLSSIYLDTNNFENIYLSSTYDAANESKYCMISLRVVDDALWNNLQVMEQVITNQIKATKEGKRKSVKGFTYESTSGEKYVNLRVYTGIPFKKPVVSLLDPDTGLRTSVTQENWVSTFGTRGMQAKIAVRPDAVWSFGSTAGMALFTTMILLQQGDVEEQREENSDLVFDSMMK